MIKTIDQIIDQAVPSSSFKMWKGYNKDLYKGLCKAIKEYGESIVNECAGNFECEMESDDVTDNPIGNPVLVRQSVLNVKSQIK